MRGMSIGAWITTLLSWAAGVAFLSLFGLSGGKSIYIPLVFFLGPYVVWKLTEPKRGAGE